MINRDYIYIHQSLRQLLSAHLAMINRDYIYMLIFCNDIPQSG